MRQIAFGWILLFFLSGSSSPQAPKKELFFVFLDAGTSRQPLSPEESKRMQGEHIANLIRLYEEGKSPLAGPLGRESKKSRGIVIVEAESLAKLRSEFAEDPFVKNDYLAIRPYRWRITTGKIKKPKEETGLGEYCLAVIRRGNTDSLEEARKAYGEIEAALADRVLESGTQPLAVAGPTVDADGLVGILLFRVKEIETVRTLVTESPELIQGRLEAEIYRQYLGKGFID